MKSTIVGMMAITIGLITVLVAAIEAYRLWRSRKSSTRESSPFPSKNAARLATSIVSPRSEAQPIITDTTVGPLNGTVAPERGGQESLVPISASTADPLADVSVEAGAKAVENIDSLILARSPLMGAVLDKARVAANSDVSVLILGESGTGKKLLARAIHRASHRASNAFVAVNCALIPESLLESELFGHAEGANRDPVEAHAGRFQEAEGGTIFLAEIGDVPLTLQGKLLSVVRERLVWPVGATTSVPVNVRVISASRRGLDTRKTFGEFREDLYDHLSIVSLMLPPLRDRPEDIPLLANHFLVALTAQYNTTVNGFTDEAMNLLLLASWPGNVRELFNVVRACVAAATTSVITLSLLQEIMTHSRKTLSEERRRSETDDVARLHPIWRS